MTPEAVRDEFAFEAHTLGLVTFLAYGECCAGEYTHAALQLVMTNDRKMYVQLDLSGAVCTDVTSEHLALQKLATRLLELGWKWKDQ